GRGRRQSLPLRRSLLDRPGERRQGAPSRGSPHLVVGEEAPHLLPERARLTGAPLVCRRLAHEVEPPRRTGAGRVEQVAVARNRIGLGEARLPPPLLEIAACLLVKERRGLPA